LSDFRFLKTPAYNLGPDSQIPDSDILCFFKEHAGIVGVFQNRSQPLLSISFQIKGR